MAVVASVSLARDAKADTTFTDITAATGVSYQRARSAEYAITQAIQQESLVTPVQSADLARTPLMPHGLPGVVVFDHDNDSDLDVFVTNGPGANNALLVNQLVETGYIGFVDQAVAAGVAATAMDGQGACYGDIDNDGDSDLLVLGRSQANRLYENQGDGTFLEIASSGLNLDTRFHTSCAFGDVNGDGLLDVAVANAHDSTTLLAILVFPFALNQHNQLYLNDGDNTFTDVSASSGIEDTDMTVPGAPGITWAVSMVDMDLDGDTDIVFGEDQGGVPPLRHDPVNGVDRGFVHILFNDGTGQFTDVALNYNPNSAGSWMGIAFGDLNCDGNMDIFGANFGDYGLPAFGQPYSLGEQATRWYLGNGDGTFNQIQPGEGTAFGWGIAVFDADNDGDSDAMYHGGLDLTFFAWTDNPGVLLENDGLCSGTFTTKIDAFGRRHLDRNGRGLGIGDLDRDGFIDIVSVANFRNPDGLPLILSPVQYGDVLDEVAYTMELFVPAPGGGLVWSGVELDPGDLMIELNDGNDNGSVTIRPIGSIGTVAGGVVNRSALGAVVTFEPAGGVPVLTPITGGSSHLSAHSNEALFGLGSAHFGTVDVLWPGGVKNRLYGVYDGEYAILPEIPCSYDTADGIPTYRQCVDDSLDELYAGGVINHFERIRLRVSALLAYIDAHH